MENTEDIGRLLHIDIFWKGRRRRKIRVIWG